MPKAKRTWRILSGIRSEEQGFSWAPQKHSIIAGPGEKRIRPCLRVEKKQDSE